MPLEEISLIRREVMSVLKRLDEFVAKNSISGMTQWNNLNEITGYFLFFMMNLLYKI